MNTCKGNDRLDAKATRASLGCRDGLLVNFVFCRARSRERPGSRSSSHIANLTGIPVQTGIEVFKNNHEFDAAIIPVHHVEVRLSDFLFRETHAPVGFIVWRNDDPLLLISLLMNGRVHILHFWGFLGSEAQLAANGDPDSGGLSIVGIPKIPRRSVIELDVRNVANEIGLIGSPSPNIWPLVSLKLSLAKVELPLKLFLANINRI